MFISRQRKTRSRSKLKIFTTSGAVPMVTAETPIFPLIPLPSVYMDSNDVLVSLCTVLLCWLIASSFDAAIVILGGAHQGGTRYAHDGSTVSGLTWVFLSM